MTRYYQGVPYGDREAEKCFTERNEEVLRKRNSRTARLLYFFFPLERDDSVRINCSQEWRQGDKRGE